MDLAQFAGKDYVDLTLDGKVYRVGELTLKEWADVQAWIKATVPGPLSSLGSPDFKRLPPEVKRDVLAEVLEQDRTAWPPRIGSKAWFLALDAEGGHATLLLALLGKYQPVGRDECEAIARSAGFEQILPAVVAGLGLFGPKSPTPGPGVGGKRTSKKAARKATTSATSPTGSRKRGAGRGTTSSS